MNKKKQIRSPSTQKRSEPLPKHNDKNYVGLWERGWEDVILPGYTPLSKNEEVKRCVHIIANLVSSMTIFLMENTPDGDRRIKNELSKKLDIQPSKNMDRKNFIYKIVNDMLIHGNSVCLPSFDGNGRLIDNKIFKMSSTTFHETANGYRVHYGNKFYEPDEILHFVWIPDDDDPWKGQGYTSVFKDTLINLSQANATKTSFLKSKWKPSVVISIQSDIDELADGEKRKEIIGSYTNDTEAGEPWLIPAGEIEVKEIRPLSLADLSINDSIILDKKTVASCFGMPPFMIGVGDFNKDYYNNFISTSIMTIAQVIAQQLTTKLIYKNELYIKFNRQSLLQYNLQELTAFTKELVALGSMNRNEQRNYFDLEPKDGLDKFTPLENYIPIEKLGKQKKIEQKGGNDE